jgi:actin-like ATPase involved in cell morphogenesis
VRRRVCADEPSVVAVDRTGKHFAVGIEAKKMIGRTLAFSRDPLKDGDRQASTSAKMLRSSSNACIRGSGRAPEW